MALFGRRCLQSVLTENAVFLGPKEAENKCNLLNTYDDPHYLSTEWELAVLNAASKVGTVEYEKRMRTHQPDLLFKSSDPPLEFLADITTLSDGGLRERNPVHALQSEFWRHLSKRRLFEGGGFDVQIDPYSLSFYRGSKEKPRLKLPRQSEWPTKIFNSGFRAFLEKVSNNPEQNQRFDVIAADTGVHFEYDPTRRGMATLNHLSFEIANVIDQNTIYKALKTKAAQLKATGYKGVTGVFLCDGDCNVLRSTTGSFAAYSANEIVREFLRKSHSVTFVVRLVVRESNSQVLIEVKLDFNPKRPIDPGPLTQVISRIHQLLPRPEFTPARAPPPSEIRRW